MNINIAEVLSQGLSVLTYNGKHITLPKDHSLNIFMGIGLWSVRDGLSKGLPVDVMQMLLSAALMRSQIMEANPGRSSKVIILIADSMAIREGAEQDKVSLLVRIYKKSLETLLNLLNIKESSESTRSSELENFSENSKKLRQLKEEDKVHYAYTCTQTAINRYMNIHAQAGIKLGWIFAESSQQLQDRSTAQSLKHWDELKFDRWCEEVCQDSTMQYLYTKAGLKQSRNDKKISVSEGCPYTAYPKDQRYIVRTSDKKDIKTICPIQKRTASQWKGVAVVCSNLIKAHLVHRDLLPENCIKNSNVIGTIYNMLNHWANPPDLPMRIIKDNSILSPSQSCHLTFEDSSKQTTHDLTHLMESHDA